MDDFEIEYAERYPGIVKLWLNAWERFIPFLAYPPVIAKIVYTTDLVVILSRPGGVWDVAEKGIQDPGALPRRRLRPQAGTPDRPGPHHYQGRCDRDGYSRLERSSKHLRDLLPRSAQYLLTPNQQERKAIPLLHRRSDRPIRGPLSWPLGHKPGYQCISPRGPETQRQPLDQVVEALIARGISPIS